LRELERMAGDLADWQAALPEHFRYGIVQALRKTLAAAIRWELVHRDPARLSGPNGQPRTVRPNTLAESTRSLPSSRQLWAAAPQ
jgi:hypothetical protein